MIKSTFLYISSVVFLFLISFFSLPVAGSDADSSKIVLLVLWGISALVMTLISAFSERSWRAPFKTSLIGIASLLAFLLVLSSAFFSQIARISFFGDGYAIGVPLFFVMAMGISYIVSLLARDTRRGGQVFLSVIGGVAVATTISLVAILIRSIFGMSQNTAAYMFSLVSKWNDVGIYAAMLLIASLYAIRSFALRGLGAVLGYALFVVSIVMLATVNLVLVWTLLCITSVVVLVSILKNKETQVPGGKCYVWCVALLALISLVFVLDNHFGLFKGNVAGFATKSFDVSSIEAYPSISSTGTVIGGVMSQSPLFGYGPGRFADAWRLYRPQGVNLSQFWSTEFTYGVGLWPTFVVTTGIVGALGLLTLVLVIIWSAIRLYRKGETSGIVMYINRVVALIALFMTVIFFVYSPGIGAAFVYAAVVGLLIGFSYKHETVTTFEVSLFARSNVFGLATVLVVVLVALGSLWMYTTKVIAAYQYNIAITIPATDSAALYQISDRLQKAFNAEHRDTYARALGTAYYAQFNNLLVASSSSYTSTDFQNMLNSVIGVSSNAIVSNPFNAQNYLFVAELFRSLAAQGVSGASKEAEGLYTAARVYEPYNPLISVLEARLALQNKDSEAAQTKLQEAINLKPNYTEAVFLLSQILIENNGSKEAISQLEARSKLSPVEPIVFFQLGFLKYANKDYTGAVPALEAAVSLVPDYSNAMYFLGLAYYNVDRTNDAIAAFERVVALNPDSAEAASVLANLKAGKAPFATAVVTPEKRAKLPVNEKTKTQEE
jgi:tetratricopeptide (TPR) repeat protein